MHDARDEPTDARGESSKPKSGEQEKRMRSPSDTVTKKEQK